jgi:hypothetical protein
MDICPDQISFTGLPVIEKGQEISRVDVIVRVKNNN